MALVAYSLLCLSCESENNFMKEPLHIIHLEDDLMDASMLEAILSTEQIPCKIQSRLQPP